MTVLRLLAIVIALAGMIDPAITMSRPRPVPVRLVADGRDPDAAAAASALRAALPRHVDVVSSGPAAATVVIGGASTAALEGPGPISLVSLEEPPSLRIAQAPASVSLVAGSRTHIPVRLEAVGLAGRTSAVILEQDGVELARVQQAGTDDGSAIVQLPYVAPVPGARRLTVRVEPSPGERRVVDNQVDVLAMVTARQSRIAIVEARPSWSAGFIRRALEADPAFQVTSLIRTSRGIASHAGDPRPVLQEEALWRYDVVIVGSPEDLQRAEVEALWQFAARRGGTVVLVPDRAPSGAYAERLPGKLAEHLLTEARALEPSGVLASEVVSLGSLPRGGRALASLGKDPVIVSWPVGDGDITFSGALDSWRYRSDPKSRFIQFWRDVLASAASNAPPALAVEVEPAVVRPGDVVRVNVQLRRTEWTDENGSSAPLGLPAVGGWVSDPTGTVDTIRLWPEPETGRFRGETRVAAPGIHTIRVETGRASAETSLVVDADATPRTSSSTILRDIPPLTGGVTVGVSHMDSLVRHLSSLSRPSQPAAVHPFRSAWWPWIFAALLCGEWAWRRRTGLR